MFVWQVWWKLKWLPGLGSEGRTHFLLSNQGKKLQYCFIFLSHPSRSTPDAAHQLFEGWVQLIKRGIRCDSCFGFNDNLQPHWFSAETNANYQLHTMSYSDVSMISALHRTLNTVLYTHILLGIPVDPSFMQLYNQPIIWQQYSHADMAQLIKVISVILIAVRQMV